MESEKIGLRLLKKGQTGLARMIFSRMGIVLVLLALNIGALLALIGWFREFLPHYLGGTALFTLGMMLYVINSRMDPTAKITWLALMMLLPVFGALFYLFTCADFGHKTMGRRLQAVYAAFHREGKEPPAALTQADPGAAALARYVSGCTGIPVSENTEVAYFPSGEAMLERMLAELEKAERTIYLEYFIVNEGVMWGQILEILARKAAQGVDVRVIYDGTCEFARLPRSYPQKLGALGIACRVFSPVMPFLSTHYNYRDHRKILTIDGQVAFTGGVNLADEYINATHPYGHWKDTAVMLSGDGAESFEDMFLLSWNLTEKNIAFPHRVVQKQAADSGFVLPYYDDPLDRELVGRQVYVDLLNRAKRYVHIMTPYLILDGELISALTYAAKRGVEVVLVVPGIPDQKAPHALAKSHYPQLLEAGVRIYEYTPGFVHAKVMVCDDREAVVGTINLDYRSLYHHFECAVYLYGVSCIPQIARDFEKTVCEARAVTPETIRAERWSYKVLGWILKAVAPLM